MRALVMKFGGASVATPKHFSRIADIILKRLEEYPKIAVVVSAMGDTTDQLISLAKEVNPKPQGREYDMLVSVGERISISLLAMALSVKNNQAYSFTGSQSGIITCGRHTDARIVDVKPHRILPHLNNGLVVIVAGFQGVSRQGEITTLGRGGSDTTAVALGVALGAAKVEFYKDVEGIYDKDPKADAKAKLLSSLTYEDAINIVTQGAEVLHPRSVKLAQKNNLPLHILSFEKSLNEMKPGTIIAGHREPRPEKTYAEFTSPIYEEQET